MILAAVINDCKIFLDAYSCMGMMIGAASAFLYCLILLHKFACVRKGSRGSMIHACFKIPFIALLGFYVYLVLGITLLSRSEGTAYILRLIPFSTWGTEPWHLTLWVENILMMIPLGILLYILWKPFRKVGWSMLAGCLFSLLIECTQLFNRLGKFEVDDIMNNAFGTLLGFLFCKGIGKLRKGYGCPNQY